MRGRKTAVHVWTIAHRLLHGTCAHSPPAIRQSRSEQRGCVSKFSALRLADARRGIFGCPIRFGTNRQSVVFATGDLALPIRSVISAQHPRRFAKMLSADARRL